MFKCKVERVFQYPSFQETVVFYGISSIGNTELPNHKLVGTYGNKKFTIGQIDKSIKVGDLLRCDGLPYMTKPVTKEKIISYQWAGGSGEYVPVCIGHVDKYPGYSPFQLDSGYWVLRKNEHLKKKEKIATK